MKEYTIYGKGICPFCVKAKTLLQMKGLEFKYVEVPESPEAMQLFERNGWSKVPQVFHRDNHLGGFTELREYLR